MGLTSDLSKPLPLLSYEEQQQITRLCIRCGLLLMQYGAESATVVDLCRRLGLALGVSGVECGLAFNGITLTTLYNNRCITTLRASTTHVINVHMIIQIQQIVLDLEAMPNNHHQALTYANQAFDDLNYQTYPWYLTALMVGCSCACFSYLAGGNLPIVMVTFVAGVVGFTVRYWLTKHFFNPFLVTMVTAFCASIIGCVAFLTNIGNDPHIAIASSVILLVPSFPLINSLSDMLKGYMNMGVGRFMFVIILTLSACLGIVSALLLFNIRQWGLL